MKIKILDYIKKHHCLFIAILLMMGCREKIGWYHLEETDNHIRIETDNYQLSIEKQGFKYGLYNAVGEIVAQPHPDSGLQFGESLLEDAASTKLIDRQDSALYFQVIAASGVSAKVVLQLNKYWLKWSITPEKEGVYDILMRTQGIAPAYGMGDHAGHGVPRSHLGVRASDEITGITFSYQELYKERSGFGGHRMISNFAIFPKQGLAHVNIEPGDKLVRFLIEENAQGSERVRSMPAFYYFFGNPKQIYQSYLDVRNQEGFPVMRPKFEWFGVGWEAWGALAWRTNHQTVKESIDQYLEKGYPLRWMVVGSGFWPSKPEDYVRVGMPPESADGKAKVLQATTSFGMWGEQSYPNPKEMIEYFHQKGLLFNIGLRTGFIPGGPFTEDGLKKRYFLTDEAGEPRLFKVGFPKSEVYIVDAKNLEAVNWYVALCDKWLDYGIDGFKEDLYGYDQLLLQDDFVDAIHKELMEKGVYVMGRNAYLGSPADIHRYNDFNLNQPQDRGPLNGLAYAYSGFPNVYPDVVGGTGLASGAWGEEDAERLRRYVIRYAQYAAVNPSMSFGYGSWLLDSTVNHLALKAANLHEYLLPTFYDAALDAYETGYPYPMTPLPIAFPQDENTYHLADTSRRSFQWLIGSSLMAAPLYGNDFATAEVRDIYLPQGTWMDFNTGKKYAGGQTLKDYAIPLDKIPLFVGGNGMLLVLEDSLLKLRVFPVAERAKAEFSHHQSTKKTYVEIANPNWELPNLIDIDTEEILEIEKEGISWKFVIQPGRRYKIH